MSIIVVKELIFLDPTSAEPLAERLFISRYMSEVEAPHVKRDLSDVTATPLPERGDAADIAERRVVDRVEVISKGLKGETEPFRAWEEQVLVCAPSSLLGETLARLKLVWA